MKRRKIWLLTAILSIALSMAACGETGQDIPGEVARASMSGETAPGEPEGRLAAAEFSIEDVEAYAGEAYVAVNGNEPYFSEEELTGQSFESYSELDELGRCGTAYACVGTDLMPTQERESISEVRPTGWQSVKYDGVDGKYLYNRCHLIGFQLSGENANEKNLITGTRYLNVDGMLPFENMIADYVKETDNHVMYRVTPVFEGENLVASGVLLEAQSVEDQGEDLQFCVYVYNVQPGIAIDYATGESSLEEAEPESGLQIQAEEPQPETAEEPQPQGTDYILNTSTGKFHYPTCESVKQMKESNREAYTGSRDDVIRMGYDPCKKCNP